MEKIRTRVIIIVAVIAVCVFGIIGLPRNFDQLKQNIADRIHLGLDLKGGTHLVLQVHVDDAVKLVSDQALERLRDGLQAKNIPYADIRKTDLTHILIKGIPPNRLPDVQALVNDQFSDWQLGAAAGDPNSRVLALKTTAEATIKNSALDQTRDTIDRRVNAYGVVEATVADYGQQGDYELVIELPSVTDPTRVRDIIQQTAMLELKIVQDGPYPSREAALAAHGGVLPPDTDLLPGQPDSSDKTSGEVWYIVNQIAAVTGRDLSPGGAQPSQDQNGRPNILFNLTRDGASRFGQVTAANVNKRLAIVLDNRVVEAPTIETQITDRGEIHGGFTPQQAADLALVLNSGSLPASISTMQEETVGASLGADSIRHGIWACIVGFAAIMGFMLIYYRGGGINADLALILNLVILISALAYFGATLTLPGIAGVILTVGMGVDSNVLIFERIREEMRAGKAVGAALSGGFEQAFRTIIDTHVTTVASAAILFTFGTGPIKGFAVTLTIGLVANLFTSVYVSRTIFDFELTKRRAGQALSLG
ncbi:MAG TPA: protein translocase subunit SecD [Terriglobia bacterium]|nr:protein translocase subunit SecD [Terriglobia bacterium]